MKKILYFILIGSFSGLVTFYVLNISANKSIYESLENSSENDNTNLTQSFKLIKNYLAHCLYLLS